MEVSKRIVSLALSTIMLATTCLSASSCKVKTAEAKKVSDDAPWFTVKETKLDPCIPNKEDYLVFNEGQANYWHGKFVVEYTTEIQYEDDLYPESSHLLGIYGEDGSLLHLADIDKLASDSGDKRLQILTTRLLCEIEKGVRLYFSTAYNDLYFLDIDLDTGLALGSPKKIDLKSIGIGSNDQVATVTSAGDYEVFTFSSLNDASNKVFVFKDGEVLHEIDLDKQLGPGELAFIQECREGPTGTALITGFGQSIVFVSVDLATGKVTKLTGNKMKLLDYSLCSTVLEGKQYISKATGVYEYDTASGNEVCRFNFDNCNINRYDCEGSFVLHYEENKIILGCNTGYVSAFSFPPPQTVYTLEKADKNPNAGKTIVTVACLGGFLSRYEGEAIKIFNERNQEYYAQLILYEDPESTDGDAGIDSMDKSRYNAMAMVSGSLLSDIRSGMAPDVILGASQLIDLMDSTYLKDLSPYLKNKNFDPSAYYSNVIDASQMNGKMYFIPTAFAVTGIIANGTTLESGQKGFTYDQYVSFVKQELNGKEPVTQKTSRMHFLNLCVERNYVQWLKNNKLDFDREDFRKLSEFFLENIPEGVTGSPVGEVEGIGGLFFHGTGKKKKQEDSNKDDASKDDAAIDQFSSFSAGSSDDNILENIILPDDDETVTDSMFTVAERKAVFNESIYMLTTIVRANIFGDNIRVMGLPSEDGTGPSASIYGSFSITEGTPVEKGAYEFLNILISEEAQKGLRDAVPINRAAALYKLEQEKAENLTAYNRYVDMELESYGYNLNSVCQAQGVFDPKSKIPDVFLEMLENVDSVLFADNSVMMIVTEEMPPYLVGQKDLDSVISTINRRTKTVFDER